MGADPAPYSMEKMRHTLESFIRYTVEQAIIDWAVALEKLLSAGQMRKDDLTGWETMKVFR